MNLISLVLFGTQTRYWYTLLPALVTNLELYPDYTIRLHVASEAKKHEISHLLEALIAETGRFQVMEYSEPYRGLEPSIWRMRPLWDKNVNRFLCRDVDSVPSTHELQAVRAWERSGYPIQSIRSFHLHTTLLMAGLCGFVNGPLDELRDAVPSFEAYAQWGKEHCPKFQNFDWGCDQEILGTLLWSTYKKILDFPVGNCQPWMQEVPVYPKEKTYEEPLTDLNQDLLKICDEITAVPWGDFDGFAGRPHGDFRPWFQKMMELPLPSCDIVRRIFDKHPDIKAFYTT